MKQVKRILVAIDRSAMANEALKRAISIAHDKNTSLVIVHDLEPPFFNAPCLQPVNENEIKKEISDQVDLLNLEAKVEYSVLIEHGIVTDTVINIANKINADLLVIGLHGKNDTDSYYFGASAFKIIQKTNIPMLVVKNKVKGTYQNMVLPTNLSDISKESILFANTLFTQTPQKYIYAHEIFTELQALTYHVSEEDRQSINLEMATKARSELEAFVKEVGKGKMVYIDFSASVNEDLLSFIIQDKADLIVLGSKGIGTLNSFVFGSTASYLLHESPSDILIHVPQKS